MDMLGKGVSQLPRVLDIMGFDKLRPGQDRGIMSIMGGQDTICVFPTSMGKSAVYLIPALCHNWRLLVVSPLKALMRDQVKSLQEKGIGALSISSDQRDGENQQCVADWVRGDCKILYIAPERLKRDDFIRALRQAPPDMIAVDEAHVLSGWADNFRHAYMFIGEVVEMFQPRVVAAFSATMPKEIEEDVRRVLRMPNAVKIFHFPKRENLKLSSGDLDLRNDLFERVRDTEGAVLVYCGTKDLTNKTSASLARFLGEEVGCYHSEVNESTKKMYQDSFKDDRIRVMCATNAFGMGVDKGNIRAVFHFRHPGDPEALSQECVHPCSMISTAAGIQIASEVSIGERMFDFDFEKGVYRGATVVETMTNQAKSLKELRTKLGSTLLVTSNHPIFSKRGGEVVEVPAGELVAGDTLIAKRNLGGHAEREVALLPFLLSCPEPVYVQVLPALVDMARAVLSVQQLSNLFRLRRLYDYGAYRKGKAGRLSYWLEVCQAANIPTETLLEHVVSYKTRSSQRHTLPITVDTDLAWFVGIVATDGYMFREGRSGSHGYGSWKVKLANVNRAIVEKFERVVSSMGLHVSWSRREPDGLSLSKQTVFTVEVSSPILQHLLACSGIPTGKKSYSVRTPSWLINAPLPLVGAYLAGVIDGDGNLPGDTYRFRIHSASWSFISDLSMLLRQQGIVAKCYSEDYTCKREVMKAAAERGYSLCVSSTEQYERVRGFTADFSCKPWMPVRPPNSGQDMTSQRKLRPKLLPSTQGEWLEDEVMEIHDVVYNGPVLNWRVEPGNQLVVGGVLTHNCGRAGRDGLPSVCHTYASKEAVKLNEGFIEKGYPPRDYYEKVFKALTKNCRNDGTFTMTSEALEKQSGVWEKYHSAIMEALHGHRVIENLADVTKTHRVRFKNTSEEGAPFRFLQLKEVLPDIATEEHLKDGCWFSFDADYLSSKMNLTPATIIKHIKAWNASDLLTYDPPPPGKVKRIIGDLDLIDFKRLNVKKNKALARLDYVKGYFNVPDHEKHDYLNDYFLNL